MAKLLGKALGDVITEYYGPITGVNYNVVGAATPVAPFINVQVFGTGEVQLEENTTFQFVSPSGASNTFTNEKRADPDEWVAIGDPLDQSSGLTALSPTVNAQWTVVRAVVTGVGEGKVVIQSNWR